ncbi:MAG: hypothetical protein EU536_03755 [Promethearchaeota archaeon]|nr:MAG: hypothetical protein EU536_03755 [Candidatus Lokiarchaeota archaeon]
MDDSLIDALEARIKKMSDLRRIMNDMKHTLSEVKITVEDFKNYEKDINDALKFTLQIKELDEWSLHTLKLFRKINESGGFKPVSQKKVAKTKTEVFVDLNKAKQGLLERGIEVLPEFEPQFQEILNKSITMTLDFLVAKEKSIQQAQKLIEPYRKGKVKA